MKFYFKYKLYNNIWRNSEKNFFPLLTDLVQKIYSNFGIVFCEKNKINKLIENIKNQINSAGFFVGNFLGIEDKWNDENHKDMKFFTSKEVKEIFKDWKIWYISDKHYIMDSSKEKEKNWHVIEIYAQK